MLLQSYELNVVMGTMLLSLVMTKLRLTSKWDISNQRPHKESVLFHHVLKVVKYMCVGEGGRGLCRFVASNICIHLGNLLLVDLQLIKLVLI